MDREEKIELTKEILKITAVTTVILVSAVLAPNAVGALAKLFMEFKEYSESDKWRYRLRAKKAIKSLEQRGLVVTETRGEKLIVKITQAGRRWLKKYEIDHLTIKRQQKWDGWWRVIVFDIAEDKREIRNIIRSWLKRLGFARLQQSTWLIPWPCSKEVELLKAEYKLGNDLILLETKKIAKESALKRIFKL